MVARIAGVIQPAGRAEDRRHVMTQSAGGGAGRPFAVVTGGSEGIGLAIAERLVRDGTDVLIVARDEARLQAVARQLADTGPGRVEVLPLDVTVPQAGGLIEERVAAAGGYVDLLVNNAGIGLGGAFAASDPQAVERMVALNVQALTTLMRHVLPGMQTRRRGGVINIASLAGYVPGPYQAAYYASKAYVVSLSEAVAAEVAADGVRVTVVAPGPVETRFHAKAGAETAIYRRLPLAARPESVARWGLLAYKLGVRAVAPGILSSLGLVSLRILPHRLVVPIVAWLLRPRQGGR